VSEGGEKILIKEVQNSRNPYPKTK